MSITTTERDSKLAKDAAAVRSAQPARSDDHELGHAAERLARRWAQPCPLAQPRLVGDEPPDGVVLVVVQARGNELRLVRGDERHPARGVDGCSIRFGPRRCGLPSIGDLERDRPPYQSVDAFVAEPPVSI